MLLNAEKEVVTPKSVKEGVKVPMRSGIRGAVKPVASAMRKLQKITAVMVFECILVPLYKHTNKYFVAKLCTEEFT